MDLARPAEADSHAKNIKLFHGTGCVREPVSDQSSSALGYP